MQMDNMTTRPDLTGVDPQIKAYIEMLEHQLEQIQDAKANKSQAQSKSGSIEDDSELEVEAPTSINLISATAAGIAKRTPRHLYARQRRGGMGIFDLETGEDDPPSILAILDAAETALLITDQGRAFRLPVDSIVETTIRGRGASIVSRLNLAEAEHLCAIIPIHAQGYLAMVSRNGYVRLLRHHIFGEYMKPGMALLDVQSHGPLSGACWTPGDAELFIATRNGKAIRFSEKLVPPNGAQGIRLEPNDECVAIAPAQDDSAVFLLSADGKGTIRTMENFNPNKAPGAGGKIALSTDRLISAQAVQENDDIFIISRLSKIIRFSAAEVPPKDGVVQGVICMSLRSDVPVAVVMGKQI
jgi:DNA gyrase subunit A